MKPGESPWIEVPDDWLDDCYSIDPEIRKFQEFVGLKVKAGVLRRHLLADDIGNPGELSLNNIIVDCTDHQMCTITAHYEVYGMAWKVYNEGTGLFIENRNRNIKKNGRIKITRIIRKGGAGAVNSIAFSSMGVGVAKLPDDFADAYYMRAIPFLQKIGVKTVTLTAITEAHNPSSDMGRLLGGYLWSKYGFTNGRMDEKSGEVIEQIDQIKSQFLHYLGELRNIQISNDEVDYIKSMTRMNRLSQHTIKRDEIDLRTGRDFLLGDDGTGTYSRDVIWLGVIPDIHDCHSKEMRELAHRLVVSGHK